MTWFLPFLHKRKSFEYEQELRAILIDKPQSTIVNKGENVDVKLSVLIENIYVSPKSPEWFKDLVASITKKYGLDIEPRRSDLDADALY